MLTKIKNFMNRPITWGDSFKYAAGVYAVYGIILACVCGYIKVRDWLRWKKVEKQNKNEERPEW